MLLSTAYFPPVSWLALAAQEPVQLEACENYQKQSYRNRCYILSGDGPQMLQVPVMHGREKESFSLPITSVKVDYSTPWILRTERALATAYESSAYFEYYKDSLFETMEARPDTLWELNLSLIRWCLNRCHIDCRIEPTPAFTAPGERADDFRYRIHPKHPDTVLADLGLNRPYYQVFRDRLGGFTPKMSCLDLLFNEGPDSIFWLKQL